jgi:ketosteroid isomerase-like protein
VTDQDIQTVEAVLAAFRRGDVEAVLHLNHPDAEWVNPDYAIEAGTRHGREEIRLAVERLFEFFEDVEVESMERTPDGRILVVSRVRSRGMAGGRGIEARTSTIYTVRDGLLVRYEWFRTPEEGVCRPGCRRRISR